MSQTNESPPAKQHLDNAIAEPCPLCAANTSLPFYSGRERHYFRCQNCELIFLGRQQLPSISDEKYQYDLHINSPHDTGYRTFLNRLLIPLASYLTPKSKGLDFGCGPGPTLSVMLSEQGHKLDNYDPIYAPQLNWQHQQYDFICSTEVLEHMHWPAPTLGQLWACLKPNGVLGIMTKRSDNEVFEHWHYKNDPTHVRFYANKSFEYLATLWRAELEFVGKDVVLLKKPLATR